MSQPRLSYLYRTNQLAPFLSTYLIYPFSAWRFELMMWLGPLDLQMELDMAQGGFLFNDQVSNIRDMIQEVFGS